MSHAKTAQLPRLRLTTPSFANEPVTMPSHHDSGSIAESLDTVPLTEPSSSATLPSDDENVNGDEVNDVNWDELARNERETRSDQTTSLLLARLEQENNALEGNPKSPFQVVSPQFPEDGGDIEYGATTTTTTTTKKSPARPLSVQQIRTLINDPVQRSSLTTSTLRFSCLPTPQLTELEFWAALVSDYATTAQRLPTLTTSKIHGGVPPPLRGVVWPSIAGALDDTILVQEYERLSGETSPYEPMIGKDIGRSFPNVEMFRDADGEGQAMLAKVLKCFSLYDTGIGYCQGLGFVVGPLLMHMSDREAFCVLVRLMNHYDLRSCFLPTLQGLLLRTYQFQALVARHLPKLHAHLQALCVEPVYASQWFLSFFAVTCPMPMLLRIYDVLLVEGACETLMRVALSLMQRNEQKILRCHEFEDVMQLLLSRSLWDTYCLNADDLVADFVSLTDLVTRDSLVKLESEYNQSKTSDSADAQFPHLQSAASRFLGRLWSSAGSNSNSNSNSSSSSASVTPGKSNSSSSLAAAAAQETQSNGEGSNLMVGRSPSKQSMASTLHSIESMESAASADLPSAKQRRMNSGDTSASSNTSVGSTGAGIGTGTDAPRKIIVKKTTNRAKFAAVAHDGERNLHKQIEDLLLALSDLQRAHCDLARELQREREERAEDAKAGREMLAFMRKTVKGANTEEDAGADSGEVGQEEFEDSDDNLSRVMLQAVDRFESSPGNIPRAIEETKEQLRDEIIDWKTKHDGAASRYHEVSRQLDERERKMMNLNHELRETRARLQEAHSEKQRTLRAGIGNNNYHHNATTNQRSASSRSLRELRLGKTDNPVASPPPPTAMQKSLARLSTSFRTTAPLSPSPTHTSLSSTSTDDDRDELVQELATAKTSEAIARQELDEVRVKLDTLRRLVARGGTDNHTSPLRSSSSASSATTIPPPTSTRQTPSVRLLRTSTASGALEQSARHLP